MASSQRQRLLTTAGLLQVESIDPVSTADGLLDRPVAIHNGLSKLANSEADYFLQVGVSFKSTGSKPATLINLA